MIYVRRLSKRYGSVIALNDVTFTIQPGIITALIGHNGAGKTTSLRMMVGLVIPDTGTVEINGLIPHRQGVEVRRQTIYVPDTPFFSAYLTGEEHLQFQADVYKQPGAFRRGKQLAERYSIAKALTRPVGAYSRGMTQRLALVRALMIDSSILLLDEPFNALDPIGITLLSTDLKERVRQGGIVLISTHLLAMLEGLAQEAVVLKEGHLVHEGSLDKIDWLTHMEEWFGQIEEDDQEVKYG